MNLHFLSDCFIAAGTKVLTGTEVNPEVSHGHELQGISRFRAFLGDRAQNDVLPVTYVWLSDDEEPISLALNGTWYDSRKNQPHRASEYRFYYPAEAEDVVYRAKVGDTLFLCQPKNGPLLALFCPHGSSIESQLLWLFNLEAAEDNLLYQVELRGEHDRSLDFVSRYILELINIDVVATEEKLLDKLLHRFGPSFPQTRAFSAFARENVAGIDCRADPDAALLAWMESEERLFRTLEKYLVSQRLASGFISAGSPDVDGFISFSLSVQNRRKSRAGMALANHIEVVLQHNGLRYKREATTEKRAGPDFLFPGEAEYFNPDWPVSALTMLGAKTTCKDRWRQVLAEADRIEAKHLLTLEPGISVTQTDEMRKENLQLVIPAGIHVTYKPIQREQIIKVADFITIVRERQA